MVVDKLIQYVVIIINDKDIFNPCGMCPTSDIDMLLRRTVAGRNNNIASCPRDVGAFVQSWIFPNCRAATEAKSQNVRLRNPLCWWRSQLHQIASLLRSQLSWYRKMGCTLQPLRCANCVGNSRGHRFGLPKGEVPSGHMVGCHQGLRTASQGMYQSPTLAHRCWNPFFSIVILLLF